MPTYEYKCPDCGCRFERFQPMSAKPIKECPECKKKKVVRLLGMGAGIIFKGSGFYETDYKRKSSCSVNGNGTQKEGKKKQETESKPQSSDKPASETKTDSKAKSD